MGPAIRFLDLKGLLFRPEGFPKIKYYIFVVVQLLRKIVFPFSLLYFLVVRVRNYAYDQGWFTSKEYATPTICVGNLSVGGTGKTPMAEYLIRLLKDTCHIALLSRGYKRASKGFVLADQNSTVEDLGDEPFQIFQKFPEVTVAVDADRQKGIETLEATVGPDLILLDDAFQHRKVKASLNILLTAYGKLYRDDWYLPTGNLRDSKKEARRAQIIVVTKCPPNLPLSERTKIAARLRPLDHQKVVFSYLEYQSEAVGNKVGRSLDFFKQGTTTLVTGIADPGPFVQYLWQQQVGTEHLRFNDHHMFNDKELERLNAKEKVLTTEKDYVRLKGKVENLYYLPVQHRFFPEDREEFKKTIRDVTKRCS